MPCYYCGEAFVPKDHAVRLELVTMAEPEPGGLLAEYDQTVYAHTYCVGSDGE